MGKTVSDAKIVVGKQKNGHKMDCTCHICENMKNKAKRGGYDDDLEKEQEKMMGGTKKKNGHRKNCKCPICENMNNFKRRGGNKTRKNRKLRGGDGEEEESEIEETVGGRRRKRGNGHKPSCGCPICKNMRKNKKGGSDSMEIKASDAEYEEMDDAERGVNMSAGSRRKYHRSRKTKRSQKNNK